MGRKIASKKPLNIYTLPVGTELTGELISLFIEQHSQSISRYDFLASYVDGDEPLMSRKAPNKLLAINDFAGYIVGLNSAYLVGTPVQYQATEGIDIDPVLDIYKDQTISDLDSELAEDCSEYGKAYELVYSDEESNPVSVKLNVRNTFIIHDDTFLHKPMYAVTLSPIIDDKGNVVDGGYNITVFSNNKISKLLLKGTNLTILEEEPHFFGEVPVIEYANNRRFIGDYEQVVSLIDAYNILQSDRIIDREKLVDAILAFYGVNMTEEDRAKIKDSRMITMPSDAKGEYIIKDINETDADVLRATIAKDIHKFSKTPDMSDENFAGNASGVAIAYKLLPFEQNCKTKERYFEKSLMKRFKLYNYFLNVKSKMEIVSIKDVDAIFTRSLPKNDLEISQTISNLQGLVDTPLLVSQLSFVKDGEETFELAQKESETEDDRDNEPFNNFFNQPTENAEVTE